MHFSSQGQSDDKWGPWSEWSPCSRTCGVGVTYQERECFEKEKCDLICFSYFEGPVIISIIKILRLAKFSNKEPTGHLIKLLYTKINFKF